MAEKDCTAVAAVPMDWLQDGNTEKVYEDEALFTGYDFGKVDPGRVYSLREAASVVGMTHQEMYNAVRSGSVHAVRSTWNGKRLLVRGSELLRVMTEEFVEVAR